MNLVLGTNIWTHHQVPLAKELARILGPESFQMALFEQVHADRRSLGWENQRNYPWVIGPVGNEEERKRVFQHCLDADVMVFGACPYDVLIARASAGKLTLVASERMLRHRFQNVSKLDPRVFLWLRRYRSMVNYPHVHALAIGHYAADDFRKIGAFEDRIWNWAYIVDVNHEQPPLVPDRPLNLLWAGRMISCKKVDILLRALSMIQDTPGFGCCTIVGEGTEKRSLQRLAQRLHLGTSRVIFRPSVPFNEMRNLMRECDVYILASNRMEGWGAVAGEAMSEGCVLVANEQAGAAKVLISDGETGFLYEDGNASQLALLLRRLADDYPLRMKLRQQAWERMHSLWHPRVAAERLIALCEGLLGHYDMPNFLEGPCSKV